MGQTLLDALARIERGPEFARAPTLMRVLRYLVEAEVEGRGPSLSAYRVATEAFGRRPDFDPSSSASVRVEMARLRRLLARCLQSAPGAPGIEIPQGTYRPRLVPARAPPEGDTLPQLVLPAAGPGILVTGLWANLPATQRHITVGLAHALFEELARFRWLHVVDGLDTEGHQAGLLDHAVSHHECRFVLRGSVFESVGDAACAVRIELMDAATRRLVWSSEFDFDVDQLDARRTEIAASVARAVGQPMGPVTIAALQSAHAGPPSRRWAAADLTLRFHVYLAEGRTLQTHLRLRESAEAIVQEAPYFAVGWEILGCLARDEFMEHFVPDAGREETLARAEAHLRRAMDLDPLISRAAYINATVKFFQGDPGGFRQWLRTALSLNANHPEHAHWGGTFLCLAGAANEGWELMTRAGLQSHHALHYRLATLMAHYAGGRADDAARIADGLPGDAASYRPHLWSALAYAAAGRVADGRAALARSRHIAPDIGADITAELRRWMLDPKLLRRATNHVEALAETTSTGRST